MSAPVERRTIEHAPVDERHGRARDLFTVRFGSNIMLLAIITGVDGGGHEAEGYYFWLFHDQPRRCIEFARDTYRADRAAFELDAEIPPRKRRVPDKRRVKVRHTGS